MFGLVVPIGLMIHLDPAASQLHPHAHSALHHSVKNPLRRFFAAPQTQHISWRDAEFDSFAERLSRSNAHDMVFPFIDFTTDLREQSAAASLQYLSVVHSRTGIPALLSGLQQPVRARDLLLSALLLPVQAPNTIAALKSALDLCLNFQGRKADPHTLEEPGKVFSSLHPTRYLGVDSTALFLIALSKYQQLAEISLDLHASLPIDKHFSHPWRPPARSRSASETDMHERARSADRVSHRQRLWSEARRNSARQNSTADNAKVDRNTAYHMLRFVESVFTGGHVASYVLLAGFCFLFEISLSFFFGLQQSHRISDSPY
jgi:hypothetical protein